jgi:ACR3 family arsenite efflux pump ArsB
MSIPYKGSTAICYLAASQNFMLAVIHVCYVEASTSQEVSVSLPSEIQQLIKEFATLFEVPSDLPPERFCDHNILLVEGA